MDQLKEFLGLFRRQHFWFILPVLLIMSSVGWYLASGNIQEEVTTNVSAISGYHAKATQVQNHDEGGLGHPNEEWHEAMAEFIAARRKNVEDAWRKKWDRQSSILVWPQDAFGPRSASVVKVVETMRPIETANISELGPVALNDYKEYVQKQLPKIAEKIDSVWDPDGTLTDATGARRNADSGNAEMAAGFDKPIVVTWNPESQKFIQASFDWGAGYPSTIEVLYAQEDLWILNALAEIIKKTNGTARTQATAAVKEIVSIKYGKYVNRNGTVIRPEPPPSESNGAEDDLMAPGSLDPDVDVDVAEPDAVDGATQKQPHLAAGRYVDENFRKINSIEELKSKLDIAKRIPVQLRVRIDQRYLNRLLAACANSRLTYEVRQVRLNPPDPPTFGAEGFAALGQTTITAPTTFGDFGNLAQTSVTVIAPEEVDRLDRVVELWGIVYIFNPVDPQLLNGGDADGADLIDYAAN